MAYCWGVEYLKVCVSSNGWISCKIQMPKLNEDSSGHTEKLIELIIDLFSIYNSLSQVEPQTRNLWQ